MTSMITGLTEMVFGDEANRQLQVQKLATIKETRNKIQRIRNT